MNIYFDIDGVLKGSQSPRDDIEHLLWYCILHYNDSIFWLTTHCNNGVNNTRKALDGYISEDLIEQIEKVFHSTTWNTLKTDAIDFSKQFVWFDDTILHAEIEVMKQYERKCGKNQYGLFLMNKNDPNAARDALEYLTNIHQKNICGV